MSEPTMPPGPPPSAPPPPPPGDGGVPSPPAPPAGGGAQGGQVSPNRSLMIVLSYLWLLALIPLLTEKDDKEVQWHAKHGLVLMGAEIVVCVAIAILQMILAMVDFLGCVGCVLYSVFWLGVLVVHVMCIVKGINGERFTVPQLSQYADRF